MHKKSLRGHNLLDQKERERRVHFLYFFMYLNHCKLLIFLCMYVFLDTRINFLQV